MKIEKMEMFHVKPRWLFLKITCDDGTVGWGEPVVEGRAQTVEAAVKVRSVSKTIFLCKLLVLSRKSQDI